MIALGIQISHVLHSVSIAISEHVCLVVNRDLSLHWIHPVAPQDAYYNMYYPLDAFDFHHL